MKKIFILLFSLPFFSLAAQNFEERQNQLIRLMNEVVAAPDSLQKSHNMAQFAQAFEEALRQEGSMNFPFDRIPHLGTLVSKDKKVRLFTWNLPLNETMHRYYGVVQYRHKKEVLTVVLRDVKDTLSGRPESTILRNGDWFGALYYDIQETKSATQVYYTLLAFDFVGGLTHCKLLDVLTFDATGMPVFGAPLFDNGRWKACRVLFEYSAQTSFFLQYLPRKKMIVFHQLESVPLPEDMVGRVPSSDFSGLIFKDGHWLLQKEVTLQPKDFTK
jgi:hypothetical protein